MNGRIKSLVLTAALALLAPCTAGFAAATECVKYELMEIEDGVSLTLAQGRAEAVSDVAYTLSFSLPSDKSEKVTGKAVIAFDYHGDDKYLLLDFKGQALNGQQCRVNGKRCKLLWHKEHILVPQQYLRQGKNTLSLEFTSADSPLNRNADYLYTLLVPAHARELFPCFDQPDLKAKFSLSLEMPGEWKAISTGRITSEKATANRKLVVFSETELLPTYLFSFSAGMFQEKVAVRDGREITCLYRETDPTKVAQLDEVIDQVALSLRWMEAYTGIPMPFSKYGFVVVPGYQFGGMEHPGAIQFNDNTIFLGNNPTPEEQLKRLELIAHETAHLWFGDMVTMRWFNDVWTKEVFANYLAAKVSREQFPDINHDLNFLKSYQTAALSTDRTEGTHPIQQALPNLNIAGLLYGNIIYDKAPVMMRKLEQQMGSDAFQKGLQEYLHTFSYANATWDGLIDILDRANPAAHLQQFSQTWVKQKGMPTISCVRQGDSLTIRQTDKYQRDLVWQQSFQVAFALPDTIVPLQVMMQDSVVSVPITKEMDRGILLPNYDGQGYGRFLLDGEGKTYLLAHWHQLPETQRMAALLTLYENYRMHRIPAAELYPSLLAGIKTERNALIASTCCANIFSVLKRLDTAARKQAEEELLRLADNHPVVSLRQNLLRQLYTSAVSESVRDHVYNMWQSQSSPLMNERDYMSMSYRLAMARPQEWQTIVNTQRSRLTSEDRRREYDFVSRACSPDRAVQDSLFASLLQQTNRQNEPWAKDLLTLLSDESREPYNVKYVKPGLDILEEVQRTGDIFFPTYWLRALLRGHSHPDARQAVETFISLHPDYPLFLKNKLLEAAFELLL